MRLKFLKVLYLVLLLLALAGAVWPQSGLTVTASSLNGQTPAVYHFSFIVEREISPRAVLGIVFPAGFDLTQVKMADSRILNGGMQVTVNSDTVWAIRSGLGKVIASGTRVDLLLAAVVSAENARAANFQVLHRESRGEINRSRQRAEIGLYEGRNKGK